VGEVDQLDDAVDERVPQGDQRPDRPVRQPGLEVVECPVEVVDQEEQQGRAEQEREDVVPDVAAGRTASRTRSGFGLLLGD
jgi:hypothetical protein